MLISGRAPLITVESLILASTIRGTVESVRRIPVFSDNLEGCFFRNIHFGTEKVNAFVLVDKTNLDNGTFCLTDSEAVVINSTNDFELALILKKKQINNIILFEKITNQIEEKIGVLSATNQENSICLVGHSQLDQWKITEIT